MKLFMVVWLRSLHEETYDIQMKQWHVESSQYHKDEGEIWAYSDFLTIIEKNNNKPISKAGPMNTSSSYFCDCHSNVCFER